MRFRGNAQRFTQLRVLRFGIVLMTRLTYFLMLKRMVSPPEYRPTPILHLQAMQTTRPSTSLPSAQS